MVKHYELYVGKRAYITQGKRVIHAEWDGTKWIKLPWNARR